MSTRKHKRSTRYVNSLLQGHLIWRMAMYWCIYNAALVFVIFGEKLVWRIPDIMTGESTFRFGEFVSQCMGEGRTLFMAMAVFCPLLVWDMLKFSHRIAGPLYRFRKAMEDHVSGAALNPVKLRDGDLLGDFQGTFNEFVGYVHHRNPSSRQPQTDDGAGDTEDRFSACQDYSTS